MLKYFAVFALVFGLAVYVSVEDERSSQQAAQTTNQTDKAAASAKTDEDHSQENIPKTERNSPSWYGFFRWPNGTTTWAVLLTLLAIAEQTKQTASAAKFAERSTKAFINKERSRLFLQHDMDSDFVATFRAVNRGQSPARVTYSYVASELFQSIDRFPKKPDYARFEDPKDFVCDDWILPGKTCSVGESDNGYISADRNKDLYEAIMTGEDTLWIYGIVRYQDSVSEDEHSIRFCFKCYATRGGTNFLLEDGPEAYRGET